MAFLPTNASQVQQFAVALYGIQVGTATMAQVQADITTVGGLNKALNAYYAASFGSSTTASVAATVAANLGLTGTAATDAAAYITAVLNGTSASSRGEAIQGVVTLFSTLTANATFGAAAATWNTKVAAAVAYTGTADVAIVAGAEVVGKAFELTADIEDVTGTSANDTFTALLADADDTFNQGDAIFGGAGNDKLYILVTDEANADNVVEISGVETVSIRNLAAAATLDATSWTGVTTVEFVRSTADAEIDQVGAAVSASIAAGTDGTGYGLIYADDALSSATAAQTVSVNTADAVFAVTTGGDDVITELSVAVTGKSALEVTLADAAGADDTLETLKVSGSGAVTLTATADEFTVLTEVDFASGSGGVTIDLTGNSEDFTLTGSAGKDSITIGDAGTDGRVVDLGAADDKITFAAGSLTDGDTVDGGAGADTLVVASEDGASVTDVFTNFETISVTGDTGAAITLDLTDLGVSKVDLADDFEITTGFTIDGYTGALTVVANADVAGDALTIASINTSDKVTFSFEGDAAVVVDELDLTDIETVTFASKSKNDDIEITAAAADGVKAIVLTGAGDVDITLTANDKLASVDASALTGVLTLVEDTTVVATTFTLGKFADGSSLEIGTTAKADKIVFNKAAFTADVGIELTNFLAAAVTGHDKLDLSSYDLSAGDLTIDDDGTDTTVTFTVNADSDLTITLIDVTGVSASDLINFNITL